MKSSDIVVSVSFLFGFVMTTLMPWHVTLASIVVLIFAWLLLERG
jgi:hypothetical protein